MYMQSFIKIGGAVLEKNCNKTMILCNFNKDEECKFFSRNQVLLLQVVYNVSCFSALAENFDKWKKYILLLLQRHLPQVCWIFLETKYSDPNLEGSKFKKIM